MPSSVSLAAYDHACTETRVDWPAEVLIIYNMVMF